MVFAAAGLSLEADTDPCPFGSYPEGSGVGIVVVLWPPGVKCTYGLPDGRTIVTEHNNVLAFWAILATGLLLVLVRRSKLAIATALVFGIGGLAALYLEFPAIFPVALCFGAPLALLATRSLLATGIASAALAIGWMAQFFDSVPAVYAILLLIIAIVPQQAEVLSLRTHPD